MLSLNHIYKQFNHNVILEDVNIELPDTGLITILGKSGSGKSTLLNIIAGIDSNYSGTVTLNDLPVNSDNASMYISYLMQSNDYLDYLTVKENITLACLVQNIDYDPQKLLTLTQKLHIDHLLNRYPKEISGGELKRMGIAKSLLKHTPVLILDEPTGPLDATNSEQVMSILKEISKDKLVIVVSHNEELSEKYSDLILRLENHTISYTGHYKIKPLPVIKKHNGSLVHVSVKQLLKDRYKYIVLMLFEVCIIVSVFLLSTSINGINKALEDNMSSSVMCHVLTLSSKDYSMLNLKDFKNGSYSYDTSLLEALDGNNTISSNIYFLPSDISHIKLLDGSLPEKENEVLVSESFYESLKDTHLYISYKDIKKEVIISGIVEPMFNQENDLYLNRQLKETFKDIQIQNEITIESENILKDYKKYSKKYNVFNSAIDDRNNYASLLKAARLVGIVFIMISIFISILLIDEVSKVVCLIHKHDYAYLLSLGIDQNRLMHVNFITSFLLGLVISITGILTSLLTVGVVNSTSILQNQYHFHLVFSKIFLSRYDLCLIVLVLYTLICFISCIKPTLEVLSLDLLSTLREE